MIINAGINLLNVDPGLVIWTTITFLVVLIVLWRFAWNPIITALDARNDKIEGDLKKSQELREEAEKLLEEYDIKLDSIKGEALQLLEEGRKDAAENKERLLKEANEEANLRLERAVAEIEQAKVKALDDLQNGVVEMTIEIVSRILRKDVDDDEHRKLVLKELESLKK